MKPSRLDPLFPPIMIVRMNLPLRRVGLVFGLEAAGATGSNHYRSGNQSLSNGGRKAFVISFL